MELSTSSMQLTFLGTGTSQGVPVIGCACPVCCSSDFHDKRLRTSALITTAEGNIVIDAGPDFRQQMLNHRVSELQAILLTHEHVDHIFGLDDIRAFNWLQRKPTDIYAERRVQIAIRRIFDYVFSRWKYPGIPQMELHDIKTCSFSVGSVGFTPVRCYHHKLPVLGFRTGNLTYLTDVNSIPGRELEKIKGTKVLVVNALRHERHISHYNLDEALQLVERVRPEKTFITHISHAMGLHREVEQTLPAGVCLAYDGLTVDI
jgi:phosphoribosyl 1,2-cyclic phosphate phosphodiesterase